MNRSFRSSPLHTYRGPVILHRIAVAAALSASVILAIALDWSMGTRPAQASSVGLVAGYAFSEASGTLTADVSGNNNTGTLSGAARTAAGQFGSALVFNGTSAFVDLGNPAALQLTGSMTVSAWIKAAAFPVDDAAGVSRFTSGAAQGFQFDTTVDTGPRTIGFKLTGASGALMIRYGATTLQLNQWYFMTGVYDAAARTLDVYLNGQLNNGTLLGTVTATQQVPPLNVNIGRRTGLSGFAFNGTIDEVRIYNRALTQVEVQADMNTPLGGGTTPPPPPPPVPMVSLAANPASVASGGASTLTWSSTDAASCVASGAWSGSREISGSQSSGALTSSGTFALACTGSGGTASASATVTVTPTGTPSGNGYTTNFPLTETPISEGGLWINGAVAGLDWTNVWTTPGLAIGRQTGATYTDASAILTGTWGPDQSVTGVVHTVNQNDGCYQEVELRLRNTLVAHSMTGYEVGFKMSQTAEAYLIIVRWNGPLGNFTYLFNTTGTQFAVRDGDVLSAKIAGNVITAYINGVQKAQVDIRIMGGTVYTTGNPGMGFNLESGNLGGACSGTNGNYGLTSFTATDAP